jgi:hypothetical protein
MRLPVLTSAALLVGFALSAPAADVNGKWRARMGDAEITFNFKVTGDKLTGDLSGPQGKVELSDGKVTGDQISFSVTVNSGSAEFKLLFNGSVSNDQIKLTRQREGRDERLEFTATKLVT